MNNNDLMNALSGLDPKYIDEAAFELHDTTEQKGKAKITRMRRVIFVTLPAVAAILLTFSVVLPAVMRLGTSDSASMPASDSAAYESAAEEAAEDTGSAYEETGSPEDAESAYESEKAAESEPMYEAEEAAESESMYEAEEAAEAYEDVASTADSDQSMKWNEEAEKVFGFEKAVYAKGILTIEMSGTLPGNAKEMDYTITGTDADGSEKTYGEGTLGDILTEKEPLTLDISDLKLATGTYTLSVGDESIEFTV